MIWVITFLRLQSINVPGKNAKKAETCNDSIQWEGQEGRHKVKFTSKNRRQSSGIKLCLNCVGRTPKFLSYLRQTQLVSVAIPFLPPRLFNGRALSTHWASASFSIVMLRALNGKLSADIGEQC